MRRLLLYEALDRVARQARHSREFLEILRESREGRERAIRAITHKAPLLVFWVDPSGKVLDAGNAHRDGPPNGDKSVFVDPKHKGHLRGRAAFVGDIIYVVVYGEGGQGLTKWQQALLRRAYPRILVAVANKKPKLSKVQISGAQFIDEVGGEI